MAKKKKEEQIQITPQMQNEFNRYANVLDGNVGTSMFGKMSDAEFNTMYNQAKAQTGYSKMSDDEFNTLYAQAQNSTPQNNTIPTLDDLISNPTLKSKEDTYQTDYSQAISDLQNALNGNDLSDGQRNAYNEFLGGLNTLQGEINAHNNKVTKTSQIRSQNPISKKEEQKKEKQISTYDKGNPMSYRDREIAKSVQATQKYNDSLKARGYSLEPKEEEVQNPTFLGNASSQIEAGVLNRPTPTPTQVAKQNIQNDIFSKNAIAKDREKIKADRAIRVAEGDYSEAISHFNNLANKEDLTKDEKKEINDEFKRLGEKYGVGRTSDIAIKKYREALKNGEISEEYANAVSNAHYRNSLEGKTAIGIANMGATLTRPLTTLAGLVDPNLRETNAEVQKQLDEWNEVAPVASTIGDMAGMLGLYSGVNIAPETIKNVGARLAINQGIDNVLDVIPRLKTNYDAGKYNNVDGTLNEKALLTDIALQEGMSAFGNGLGEGIGAISNRVAKNRAIRDFSVDDILENSTPEELGLDMIPKIEKPIPTSTLDNLSTSAKDIDRIVKDANLKAEFEAKYGVTLNGTNAENRKIVKDILGRDNIGEITPNDANLMYNVNKGDANYGQNNIINSNDGRTGEGILREVRTDGGMGETGLANGVTGREYLPSNRQAVTDVLNTRPKVFDQATTDFFSQNNIPFSEYYDTDDADLFVRALETAKANNPHGQSVDSHSVEEIQEILRNGGKTFLTADGTAGGAVDDGNLTAVFKDSLNNDTPRQGSMIGLAGVKNGAVKGDCFGEFLVNTYSRSGFEPVARMKYGRDFNKAMDAQVDQLIKEGILTEEPDVYVLKLRDGYDYNSCVQNYNTAKRYTKSELDALPEFTDYDEMLQYRDSLIKQPQKEGAFLNSEVVDSNGATKAKNYTGTPPIPEEDIPDIEQPFIPKNNTPNGEPTTPKVDNTVPNGEPTPKDLNNLDNERPLVTPEQVAENVTKDLPPETSTSRFAKTSKKVGFVSQEELLKDDEVRAVFDYAKHHEETSINTAIDRVNNNGEFWEESYLNGTKINSDEDVDTAMTLISNIKRQEKLALESGDEALANSLKARRVALLNRAREDLTEHGRTVQALSKWARTADGAELNATQIKNNVTRNWKARNIKKNKNIKEYSNRLLKALENFGNDGTIEDMIGKKPTHAQILERVKNTFGTEFSSIDTQFGEKEYEYFAKLLENNAPEWKLRQEIGNVLKKGEVSGELRFDENQKVKSILDKLVNGEKPAKPKTELSIDDIKRQIRNTLDSENTFGEIGEQFTDEDVDYLANLLHYGAKQTDIENAIATKMATGSFGFKSETIAKVNEIFEKAQDLDINSKARYLEEIKAYKLLADEIGSKASFSDKFNAWRYLAMLGNPKTHLRNIFGNLSFQIVTGMSNNLAAVMEEATNFATRKNGGIERTKAIINWAKKEDRALFDGALNDAVEKSFRHLSGNKYGDSIRSDIRNQMSVFDSKVMRAINDFNSNALDVEDFAFMKNKYATSMTGYLKANGLDASVFDAEKRLADLQLDPLNNADEIAKLQGQVKKLADAREYAIKQAEYSAFHEDNEVAKILSDLSKKAKDSNSPFVNFLGKTLIEGQIPFKKTPANILKSGIEYSPLNIVQDAVLAYKKAKGIGKDVNILKVGRLADDALKEGGEVLASDIIESMSKTLTGTGMLVMGSWMFHKGFLNSSKEPEKWQDQLEGKQNYSITIPMPDGKKFTFTIDSFAPSVMPLLVGAEFAKIMESNGVSDEDVIAKLKAMGTDLDGVLNSLYSIADPLLETSMMSGISDTLESVSKAISNKDADKKTSPLGSLMVNTALGYASQGIPTLLGQVSRAIDPIRRSTYSDKEGVVGGAETQLKKILNKTPLSVLNEPYINARGEMEYNSPIGANDNPIDFLGNLAYQMLSTGYIDEYAPTNSDVMARNVYNNMTNPDAKVFQDLATSAKVNGERVSEEDYTTYSTEKGKFETQVRGALTRNEEFNKLPYNNQAEILKSLNTLSKHVGESKINPDFNTDSKLYNTFIGNPDMPENGQDKVNRLVTSMIDEQKDLILEKEMTDKGLPKSDFAKELYTNEDTDPKVLENLKKADALVKEVYGDEKKSVNKEDFEKYENSTQFKNYLTKKKSLEDAGLSTKKDNITTLNNGGTIDEIVQKDNLIKELNDLGVSSSSADKLYNHAKNEIPSLTTEQFATTFKKINTDGNTSIKQDEMFAYFKKNNISESQAKTLWNAYGSWETVPYLKDDGTWSKKKPK